MILDDSLSILTGTLSGPVVLHGFNLFNSFSTPFSLILMSFIGLDGEFPFDGIFVVFSVVGNKTQWGLALLRTTVY
jgi:hypothetical protein